jgi:beta-N-acetylhexosaminidase
MRDSASAVLVAAVEGLDLTPEEERFFREESPAGVTLFRWNIPQDRYHEVAALNQKLQSTRPSGDPRLLIAVDQEGGRVSRFPAPFPNRGPALKLEGGKEDSASLRSIREYGQLVGAELLSVGVNVNFAPVLDIFTEPANTAIGDRCFGFSREAVSARAGAFLRGMQAERVMGCLKHFPGQGDAKVDTHLGAAWMDLSLQTLLEREMFPFRELMELCPMIMISHSIFAVMDEREASRSPVIISDWLRGRLGYRGVVVSDDMNMGALPQDIAAWKDALVDAVAAGCDILLVCRHLDRCYGALEALRKEAARSPAFKARLDDAATRVTALRRAI